MMTLQTTCRESVARRASVVLVLHVQLKEKKENLQYCEFGALASGSLA